MSAVITAPQPEAVEAGADVLAGGGNAVDAAVATALVQTVVDPIMCGLAGFGSMQIFAPAAGVHTIIDFHGRAPKSVSPDMWEHLVIGESEDGFGFLLQGRVNEVGYQSITTPMTLAALAHALQAYGSRELGTLIEPAIAYAEEGFLVRPHVAGFLAERPTGGRVAHAEYVTCNDEARRIYCPNGEPPRVGDRHANPDMARTLRRIAENGIEEFYGGEIAREIATDMAVNGGLLTAEDLAEVAPRAGEPLWGSYRGLRVATNRPPGGGVMILEMLNILESFDLCRFQEGCSA